MNNIKILLVDDHPLLRRGLRDVLAQQPQLSLLGEAATGATALQMALELKPDLVVMDLHLPDVSGIEATRQMLNALPNLKVVIYSGDTARELVDEALHAGACGYLVKSGAVDELLNAIELVMSGKLYLSPEVSAGILEDYRNSLVTGPKPEKLVLSEREKKLLQLIANGRRNKEIASHFTVSTKSVEAFRSRLTKKLGFSSSADLVRYAIREGIAAP